MVIDRGNSQKRCVTAGPNVCFWHLADIDADAEHVGYWG
jgi:hypothetical protein